MAASMRAEARKPGNAILFEGSGPQHDQTPVVVVASRPIHHEHGGVIVARHR